MTATIVQLTPADGWRAMFGTKGPLRQHEAQAIPLVVWALVEEDGMRRVEGLVRNHEFTDVVCVPVALFGLFLGYAPPDDQANWQHIAASQYLHWETDEARRLEEERAKLEP